METMLLEDELNQLLSEDPVSARLREQSTFDEMVASVSAKAGSFRSGQSGKEGTAGLCAAVASNPWHLPTIPPDCGARRSKG